MTAPTFHYSRIVDLSRPLVPSEGQHPWVRFETRIDSIVSDPGNRTVVRSLVCSNTDWDERSCGNSRRGTLARGREWPPQSANCQSSSSLVRRLSWDLSDVPWSMPDERPRLEEAAAQAGEDPGG